MAALLASLGCTEVMAAPLGFDFRFGESLDVDGELAQRPLVGHKIELVRRTAPGVRLLFPNTPVVAPEVWQPLQAKRVRYFGKHADKPKPPPPP